MTYLVQMDLLSFCSLPDAGGCDGEVSLAVDPRPEDGDSTRAMGLLGAQTTQALQSGAVQLNRNFEDSNRWNAGHKNKKN